MIRVLKKLIYSGQSSRLVYQVPAEFQQVMDARNPLRSDEMRDPNGCSADQRALRDYALSLPDAYEDFPWGESHRR